MGVPWLSAHAFTYSPRRTAYNPLMINSPFNSDDVLVCTASGVQASTDPQSRLAPGFREVLRAINGKRTVADLQSFLPQQDPVKIGIWLDDAKRMDLVKVTVAGKAAAAPAQTFEYGAYIEKDDETAALARDIAKWAKLKPQAAVRARNSDLNKTVQMATLQSGAALQSLASSGVFTRAGDLQTLDPNYTPPAMAEPVTAMFPPIGKGSALIADDDVPALGVLAGLLGAAGYSIRAAATRKQFIDELNQGAVPEVIFLKFESDTFDALKIVDKIRQHPALSRIPVIISGAQPTREEIAKSILLGASGWIVRPYTPEKLGAALHGALTHTR